MSDRNPAVFQPRDAAPPALVFDAVAQILRIVAHLPEREGVLIEERTAPHPGEWRLFADGAAGAAARAVVERHRGLVAGPYAPAALLPAGGVDRLDGFVAEPPAETVPVDEERRRPPTRSGVGIPPTVDFVPAPGPPPIGAWVAVQCHARPTGTGELQLSVRGLASSSEGTEGALGATARSLGPRFAHAGIPLGSLQPYLGRWTTGREWRSGAVRRFRSERTFVVPPDHVARFVAAGWAAAPFGPALRRHAFVIGASGAGKTACLVHWASTAIRDGRAVVAWDVHGDLAPSILARLSPRERDRVVAIDPTDGPAPGVQLLGGEDGVRGRTERAGLLAALRRVGTRDGETFWGFRIERVLDAFLRITEAEGGDLNDLVELLTDARRREATRIRLPPGELARFLDDLPAILRRNPEFLWPASARLGPLAHDPTLRALVAPVGPALPLERLLADGTSVLWRLPIGELGPEAVEYMVTLLATRVFLGACRAGPWPSDRPPRVTVILDEAHRIAPGLLTEMITEGRKFGLSVLAATQYPDRLQSEARSAAGSSVGTHVVFRLPRAAARAIAPWIGEETELITTAIAALPDGRSIVMPNGPGATRQVVDWPAPPPPEPGPWRQATQASRAMHALDPAGPDGFDGSVAEWFLLGTLALEEQGVAATIPALLRWAAESVPVDPAEMPGQQQALLHRGWIENVDDHGFRLTGAGRHWIGLDPRTGAVRESALHRALLLGAFRIFARHGIRLEIVPQGSFQFRLPDARFRLRDALTGETPTALAECVARWQRHWVWRLFGGRDIHIEAEVSGALRPERIERGLGKARAAEAYVLFVVPDAPRARRVRGTLRRLGADHQTAGVWTLGELGRSFRPALEETA